MAATAKLPEKKIETFGEALRRIRVDRGMTYKDVSDRVGVKKEQIRKWEENETIPTRFQLKKLYGTFSNLRHFTHLIPTIHLHTVFDQVGRVVSDLKAGTRLTEPGEIDELWLPPVAPKDEQPPEELITEPTFKTFGEALRYERLRDGLECQDVGSLLGVTHQAVSAWELSKVLPILDHYTKLCELWPKLKKYQADFRDIPKPGGGPGISRNVGNSNNQGVVHLTPIPEPIEDKRVEDMQKPIPAKPQEKPVSERLKETAIEYANVLAEKTAAEYRIIAMEKELERLKKEHIELVDKVQSTHKSLIEFAEMVVKAPK